MKTKKDGVVNTYSDYRYGLKKGTKEYDLMNRLDEIEVETYVDKYFYTVCNTIIFLGLIVIIMSPFIIDYFNK